MLTKESIEERKNALLEDMQKNAEQQSQLQKALEDARGLGHALNGAVQQCDDFSWVMSHPFNMLGKLPVLSVPSSLNSNKVPAGTKLLLDRILMN